MTSHAYDYLGFYTIVITEFIENHEETIQQILKDCWSLYIINANVLAPSEDYGTIFLFTYFPYTPEHCEYVKPIVYDYFENGSFVRGVHLFPRKLRNFHRCPLKVSLYEFEPFVILKEQPNGVYHIDGLEGTIATVVSERLNFTPNVIIASTNILRNISNPATEVVIPKLPRSLDMVSNFSMNINNVSM